MPKIINEGNAVPLSPPPAGIKFHCYGCGADLETTDNEPTAEAGKDEDGGMAHYGWHIQCPCCQRTIFCRKP